jgi:hypothetical protein
MPIKDPASMVEGEDHHRQRKSIYEGVEGFG